MTQEKLEFETGRKHTTEMILEELGNIDITAFIKKIQSTQLRIKDDKISPSLQWQKQLEGYDAEELAWGVISSALSTEDEMIFQAVAMKVCSSVLNKDYTKESLQTASNLVSYLSEVGLFTIEGRPGYSPMGKPIMQQYVVRTKAFSKSLKDRINADMASIPMLEAPRKYNGEQVDGGRHSIDETCFTRRTRANSYANTAALDALGSIKWKYVPELFDYETYKDTDKDGNKLDFNPYAMAKQVRTWIPMDAEFYLPWKYDFRLRAYDDSNFVTLQGTEFNKASITMAKAEVLTEEGVEELMIALATAYGMDKDTWEERLAWTDQNLLDIFLYPEDWIDQADEPLLFRKYLLALKKWDQDPTQPIAVNVFSDATSSALQIFSVLLSDKATAETCNVAPVYKDGVQQRVDAWGHVSNKMKEYDLDREFTRGHVKYGAMVMLYAAGEKTQIARNNQELAEQDLEPMTDKEAQAYVESCERSFPAAINVMKTIQERHEENSPTKDDIKELGYDGIKEMFDTEYNWSMPNGSRINNTINAKRSITVGVKLNGKSSKMTFSFKERGCPSATYRGLMPNINHSIDGMMMQNMVVDAKEKHNFELATIHDDFTSHPNHIRKARSMYTEELVNLNNSDLLNEIMAEVFGELRMFTKTGDLTDEMIRECRYSLS